MDRRATTVAFLSLAAMAWGRPAQACSPPNCAEGALAPFTSINSGPAALPANQTVLVVRAAGALDGAPVPPVAGTNVRLETGAQPVPFTMQREGNTGYWLVRPDSLNVGKDYELTYDYECGPRGTVTRTSDFTVTAPVPAPTTAGILEIVGSGVNGEDRPDADLCHQSYRYAYVNFALVPSSELKPYIPVSRIVVELEGKVATVVDYGAIPMQGGFTASARCAPADLTTGWRLGRQTVKAFIEVAGGPTLPLPEQELVLSCEPSSAGPDAGAPSPKGEDAAAGGAPPSGGGCSSAPGRDRAPLPPVLLLMAVAMGRCRWARTRSASCR